jgi:hypothetical protein
MVAERGRASSNTVKEQEQIHGSEKSRWVNQEENVKKGIWM